MYIYFIRHGQSEANALGIVQGHGDFPLTAKGNKQALLLRNAMKDYPLQAFYSSDLQRAYDTAKPLAEHHCIAVKKTERIREIYLGPLEGVFKKELVETYPQLKYSSILTSGIKGTETIESITDRCKNTIQFLLDNHSSQHVAIVSHGGFISILLTYLIIKEQWPHVDRPFIINNTSITKVHILPTGKTKFHYVNNTNHLKNT